MTGIAVQFPADGVTLALTGPHCSREPDGDVVHGSTVGLLDAVAECGAPARLVRIGGETGTTWPWPPAVADLRPFGWTRCRECARLLGTRRPSRIARKEDVG